MHYYRRTPLPAQLSQSSLSSAPLMMANAAGTLTRQLRPFRDVMQTPAEPVLQATVQEGKVPGISTLLRDAPVAPSISDQAAALLPRAASILDEEMAQGALAAAASSPYQEQSSQGAGPPLAGTLLQDLSAFAARLAALMPQAGHAGSNPQVPSLPTVQARGLLAPGQSAQLQMELRNDSEAVVILRPQATDLISEHGDRIAAEHVVFSTDGLSLSAGQAQELQLTVSAPVSAPPGCYCGLLVVAGVAGSRALLQIEVGVET